MTQNEWPEVPPAATWTADHGTENGKPESTMRVVVNAGDFATDDPLESAVSRTLRVPRDNVTVVWERINGFQRLDVRGAGSGASLTVLRDCLPKEALKTLDSTNPLRARDKRTEPFTIDLPRVRE